MSSSLTQTATKAAKLVVKAAKLGGKGVANKAIGELSCCCATCTQLYLWCSGAR